MNSTFLILSLILTMFATPTASPDPAPKCDTTLTDEAPWTVTIDTSVNGDSGCLIPLGIQEAEQQLTDENTSIPALDVLGSWESTQLTITFSGAGFPPPIVEVGGRYGDKRSEYLPLTTCLGEEVIRFDNVPKNEGCSIAEDEQGNMSISFAIPKEMNTLDEFTLLLNVQWFVPTQSEQSVHHLNHWAITLRQPQ